MQKPSTLDASYTARHFLTKESPDIPKALEALDSFLGPRPGTAIEVIQDPVTTEEIGMFDPLLDVDRDGDADLDDLKLLFKVEEYGARKTWIPQALQIKKQRRRGGHLGGNGGLPVGALVHFTAGHPDESMSQRASMAAASPFSYLCIVDDGTLGQANPLNIKGKHAGPEKAGFSTRADYFLVGIEVSCPGKMKDLGNGRAKAWFSRTFPIEDCRKVQSKDNVVGGLYYKYTDPQEQVLFQTLLWMKWNDPNGFQFGNVHGHDETASKRKDDPGGSLSISMPELRTRLEAAYALIVETLLK